MSRVSDFQKSNQKAPGKIEKLDDVSLENVSGGISTELVRALAYTGNTAIVGGLIGSLGCSSLGIFFRKQASKALQEGDKNKSDENLRIADYLDIASASCAGLGMGGVVINNII